MKKLFRAIAHSQALAALVAVVGLVAFAVTPAMAETKTVTLSVLGMTCAACPITVKKALT